MPRAASGSRPVPSCPPPVGALTAGMSFSTSINASSMKIRISIPNFHASDRSQATTASRACYSRSSVSRQVWCHDQSQNLNSPGLSYLYEKKSRGNTVDVECALLSNRTMIHRKLPLIPCDSLVNWMVSTSGSPEPLADISGISMTVGHVCFCCQSGMPCS